MGIKGLTQLIKENAQMQLILLTYIRLVVKQ